MTKQDLEQKISTSGLADAIEEIFPKGEDLIYDSYVVTLTGQDYSRVIKQLVSLFHQYAEEIRKEEEFISDHLDSVHYCNCDLEKLRAEQREKLK